jgi:tripartite-type tricarboxylate transporter receptor subunit TctC
MSLLRRRLLHLAVGAMAGVAAPPIPWVARAQAYPSRPLRCIVGYVPGGGTDIFIRLVGPPLSERLGQPFIIENRAGAATNIATESVVRAPADGYTLLGTDAAAAINATLYENLSFNFHRDIAVVGLIRGPLLMMVHPSVPAGTVPEFIAYAKANRGRVSMASAGNGNPSHLVGELFKVKTDIDMIHVPYRGAAPAVTDLLGGQVQVYFGNYSVLIEHIRAGTLRLLAVTTHERFRLLPDIPTVSEFVPDFEASQWFALGLRKNTPGEIIDILNRTTTAVLTDAKIQARLNEIGTTVVAGSVTDLAMFVAEEIEKWGRMVKFSGAKPE